MKPHIVKKTKPLKEIKVKPSYQLYEEHEKNLFMRATTFSVFERVGGKRMRTEYTDFAEAALDAISRPRALLYAVTSDSMSVCLARNTWTKYLELWKGKIGGAQGHPR
jgi:hypothetical protein